jgi:hypothetical protein
MLVQRVLTVLDFCIPPVDSRLICSLKVTHLNQYLELCFWKQVIIFKIINIPSKLSFSGFNSLCQRGCRCTAGVHQLEKFGFLDKFLHEILYYSSFNAEETSDIFKAKVGDGRRKSMKSTNCFSRIHFEN